MFPDILLLWLRVYFRFTRIWIHNSLESVILEKKSDTYFAMYSDQLSSSDDVS